MYSMLEKLHEKCLVHRYRRKMRHEHITLTKKSDSKQSYER